MSKKNKFKYQWVIRVVSALVIAYLLLMIPNGTPEIETPGGSQAFLWDQDEMWHSLETRFTRTREAGCVGAGIVIDANIGTIQSSIQSTETSFSRLEKLIFEAAPLVAACPSHKTKFIEAIHQTRKWAKRLSTSSNLQDERNRMQLYRLLYGARIAEEEILLQSTPNEDSALVKYEDASSKCPSAMVHGVRIHSGDLLLSRGGAPTSALIARGNDFPGNFSHVALVHVDEKTNTPSVIEAHIEKGVAIASVEQYLADMKLRILVLRPRPGLQAVLKDPMLPHKAATASLNRVRNEHIPYDFAMDFNDDSELFCSEVASSVYKPLGINLWTNVSTMSSPGLVNWLAAFGVRHFRTQGPSDLEYDPQLCLVAEWRSPETLLKDHVDNAVVDAMLELAESGQAIEYNHFLLPLARMMKLWSVMRNLFGKIGPVPEGMSAGAALKNQWYSAWHDDAVKETHRLAKQFKEKNGFFPPYWQLVALARKSL